MDHRAHFNCAPASAWLQSPTSCRGSSSPHGLARYVTRTYACGRRALRWAVCASWIYPGGGAWPWPVEQAQRPVHLAWSTALVTITPPPRRRPVYPRDTFSEARGRTSRRPLPGLRVRCHRSQVAATDPGRPASVPCHRVAHRSSARGSSGRRRPTDWSACAFEVRASRGGRRPLRFDGRRGRLSGARRTSLLAAPVARPAIAPLSPSHLRCLARFPTAPMVPTPWALCALSGVPRSRLSYPALKGGQ